MSRSRGLELRRIDLAPGEFWLLYESLIWYAEERLDLFARCGAEFATTTGVDGLLDTVVEQLALLRRLEAAWHIEVNRPARPWQYLTIAVIARAAQTHREREHAKAPF